MHYEYQITVAPNTPVTSPYRETLRAVRGTVVRLSVEFPWGCKGLVGVKIYHAEHQIYPANPDAWLISDNIHLEMPTDFELDEEPYALEFRGYNIDDYFSHTIPVRIDIEQPAMPVPVPVIVVTEESEYLPVGEWLKDI